MSTRRLSREGGGGAVGKQNSDNGSAQHTPESDPEEILDISCFFPDTALPTPSTVSCERLAQLLGLGCERLPEDADKNVQVIDLRGQDFKGGHVPGCIHRRTHSVIESPGSLCKFLIEKGVTDLVFTCMYSVKRAPACCKFLQTWMDRENAQIESESQKKNLNILMIEGGYYFFIC